uniref:Uncharacterized protein n=1 Tax=Rhizochromulina marina TaxID=1034831 RepID=A0A7S2R5D8_9STRA
MKAARAQLQERFNANRESLGARFEQNHAESETRLQKTEVEMGACREAFQGEMAALITTVQTAMQNLSDKHSQAIQDAVQQVADRERQEVAAFSGTSKTVVEDMHAADSALAQDRVDALVQSLEAHRAATQEAVQAQEKAVRELDASAQTRVKDLTSGCTDWQATATSAVLAAATASAERISTLSEQRGKASTSVEGLREAVKTSSLGLQKGLSVLQENNDSSALDTKDQTKTWQEHCEDLSGMVADSRAKRSAQINEARDQALESFGKVHDESTDLLKSQIVNATETWAIDQNNQLKTMQGQIDNRVEVVKTPLILTASTPRKRTFPRPQVLSSTREHSVIMQETRDAMKNGHLTIEAGHVEDDPSPSSGNTSRASPQSPDHDIKIHHPHPEPPSDEDFVENPIQRMSVELRASFHRASLGGKS